MLFKLAFRSVFSRKSSYVIILFVAFAITLFCVANAVFDSTENGVQTNYVASFTGDCYIRPKSDIQQSLFGDETPVTGELTEIPSLVPYTKIIDSLSSLKEVSGFTAQVAGACMVERADGANRNGFYVFGVKGTEYLDLMKSISIVSGEPYKDGERGAMVCSEVASKLGVGVGDTIQFIAADGPNYRIRAAKVVVIFKYQNYNQLFGRIVIADPFTVRSLLDMNEVYDAEQIDISEEDKNLITEDGDIDDLFSDSQDVEGVFSEDTPQVSNAEKNYEVNASQESTTWNNIIIRLNPETNTKRFIRKLNKIFKQKGWAVSASDWRHAAGSTALYLYWMRIIFNAGIVIVLAAGFIIVNNTLVVNILDRTREIGTLRAVGAKKRFISALCMIETFILSASGGVAGIFAGKIVIHYINKAHIVFSNSFLIQLFGSDALFVGITGENFIKLVILILFLGILGWIYPVIEALKVSPVTAIQGAK